MQELCEMNIQTFRRA